MVRSEDSRWYSKHIRDSRCIFGSTTAVNGNLPFNSSLSLCLRFSVFFLVFIPVSLLSFCFFFRPLVVIHSFHSSRVLYFSRNLGFFSLFSLFFIYLCMLCARWISALGHGTKTVKTIERERGGGAWHKMAGLTSRQRQIEPVGREVEVADDIEQALRGHAGVLQDFGEQGVLGAGQSSKDSRAIRVVAGGRSAGRMDSGEPRRRERSKLVRGGAERTRTFSSSDQGRSAGADMSPGACSGGRRAGSAARRQRTLMAAVYGDTGSREPNTRRNTGQNTGRKQ
jgi:hypothetical protein